MDGQPTPVEVDREPAGTHDTSFEDFFAKEWVRLFRALLLITGSKHEAEDVTQGAFLKLLEHWDRLDHCADLQGYLFRTALNSYRSLYRRSRLAAKRVLAPGRAEADPLEQVAEREGAVRLLFALTPRQREAIVLTGIEGMDYRQAGELLGIKEATVRALVSQARARFAEQTEARDD
jgi:RNA polymerase sigma-70 factor (ECF subfamily)